MKSILLVVSIGAMLGCGSGKSSNAADTLTERQKDSILANSKIPNARAVGSALRASDSVGAHVQRVDSTASDSTEH